ncbi:MAG: SpoIID/LytB domain-containing protein [Lachnospiraceae bacterium]|nr:SpoIID/LytB domain-containing protein [Lachnospiraceae bacterium]
MKSPNKFVEFIKRISVKNLALVIVCVAVAAGLIWYGLFGRGEADPDNNVVNKGQVAKAVSLLFHTMDEIKSNETDHFPNDDAQWYEKYINMMYADTYYTTKEVPPTEKEALSSFTYSDLEALYTNVGVVDEELLSYVKNNKGAVPIKLEEWNEIYEKMVNKLDVNKTVEKVNLIISGTVSKDATLPEWTAATTYGQLGFEGLSVDYYIDKGITVLLKDNQILSVLDAYSDSVTYHNCWVISMSGGNIKAYVEGSVREFISSDKTSIYNNVAADITIEDNKLISTKFKTDAITGKVMASSDAGIEIENVGKYQLDENCQVYKIYGNIKICSVSDVLVGYDAQKFVLNEEGKICAIVIDRDVEASNIRVLLKTTGFSDIYHEYVTVKSEEGLIVTGTGGVAPFEVAPGEEYTFSVDSEALVNGRVTIRSKGVEGKVGITSLKRGYGAPYYRGSIEVVAKDGKLIIINELPLEQYLYSVVPSEMPWSYNYEALKAQAICARSFAYLHIMGNGYSEFGAHVDDSTTYQVYNNSEEQTVSNAAVDETYGQVVTHSGDVISTYFFSTSSGVTTTSEAVWGSKLPYTAGVILNEDSTGMNLRDETIFDAFIRTTYSSYDSEYPWYRWKVTFTLEELTTRVNSQIGNVKSINVQVLNDKGQWINEAVTSVGQVKKIETGTRGQGGVLEYVTIFGTDATIRVYKENNIRKIFNPEDIAIRRGSGDEVTTMTMLPSGFFIMDEVTKDNLLSAYTFVGGGYGHGVGMSQNAANTMAKQGKTCQQILEFFYKDVKIEKKY